MPNRSKAECQSCGLSLFSLQGWANLFSGGGEPSPTLKAEKIELPSKSLSPTLLAALRWRKVPEGGGVQTGPFKPALLKRIEAFGVSDLHPDECLLFFHATRKAPEGEDPLQHSIILTNYRLLKLDHGDLACELELVSVVNATQIPKAPPGWDQLLVNIRDDRRQIRAVNLDIYFSKACAFFRDVLNEIGRDVNSQTSLPDFVRGTLRRVEQLPDKSRYPPEASPIPHSPQQSISSPLQPSIQPQSPLPSALSTLSSISPFSPATTSSTPTSTSTTVTSGSPALPSTSASAVVPSADLPPPAVDTAVTSSPLRSSPLRSSSPSKALASISALFSLPLALSSPVLSSTSPTTTDTTSDTAPNTPSSTTTPSSSSLLAFLLSPPAIFSPTTTATTSSSLSAPLPEPVPEVSEPSPAPDSAPERIPYMTAEEPPSPERTTLPKSTSSPAFVFSQVAAAKGSKLPQSQSSRTLPH